MAAPSDRNARIALAKGWIFRPEKHPYRPALWQQPDGTVVAFRPDFVGTLEGVSGMLRELYEATDRVLEVLLMPFNDGVQCILDTVSSEERYFWAPWERWGDCVGDAWLSVKEAADGS